MTPRQIATDAAFHLRNLVWGAVVNGALASALVPPPLRRAALRALGFDLGADVVIASGCFFGGRVAIGPGTFLNHDAFVDAAAPVTIGSGVSFGMQVSVVTSTHELGPSSARAGVTTARPVTIEDGCWLGAGARVLPGVTVARGCVVAAGAVVTASTEPDGLYAGTPAARVRDLPAGG